MHGSLVGTRSEPLDVNYIKSFVNSVMINNAVLIEVEVQILLPSWLWEWEGYWRCVCVCEYECVLNGYGVAEVTVPLGIT